MRKLALVLLLTSALSHKVTGETKTLDNALNAVDDCYTTCRDEMLQVVQEDLLGTELNATKEFNKAWSQNKCQKIIPGGAKIHTNAWEAFGHNEKLRTDFNDAVQTLGGNASVYNSNFQFKSLHFLLMDSLHLLKAECKTVYHGSEHNYKADVGAEVRFGRFITAESKLSSVTEDALDGTVFNITSCSVVNLYDNACAVETGGWLISPAERFTVEGAEEILTRDGDQYTMINLRSSKTNGNHDCYYFQRPTASPQAPAFTTGRSSDTRQLASSVFGLMALSLAASLSFGSDHL